MEAGLVAARGGAGVHRKRNPWEKRLGRGGVRLRGSGGQWCGLACHLLAALSTVALPTFLNLEKCYKNTTVIFALDIYVSNFNHQNTDT